MNSNLIAVNWNYQNSITAWNLSWTKTNFWLSCQYIITKKLAKNVTFSQEFAIIWTLTKKGSKINFFIISKFSSFFFCFYLIFLILFRLLLLHYLSYLIYYLSYLIYYFLSCVYSESLPPSNNVIITIILFENIIIWHFHVKS